MTPSEQRDAQLFKESAEVRKEAQDQSKLQAIIDMVNKTLKPQEGRG